MPFLFDTDAILIARYPSRPHLIGRAWPQTKLFRERLPQAPSGTYFTESLEG